MVPPPVPCESVLDSPQKTTDSGALPKLLVELSDQSSLRRLLGLTTAARESPKPVREALMQEHMPCRPQDSADSVVEMRSISGKANGHCPNASKVALRREHGSLLCGSPVPRLPTEKPGRTSQPPQSRVSVRQRPWGIEPLLHPPWVHGASNASSLEKRTSYTEQASCSLLTGRNGPETRSSSGLATAW